ncbi:MAG TPA: serine protein kinase RIO [Candidatus Nitrosotalea sp.]|nr:serine protein kinase RIO [Candidatus Nitrosotalea sp.]
MLTDELQKKLAKRIDGKLLEKDREKKSEKDGFNKNKVIDEVFDKSTTMTVSGLINSGIISYVNGAVGSGKESKTFWAVGPSGNDLALKIYLVATSNFKKRHPYLLGDPRFSKIRKGTRNLVELWAQKEFSNLSHCFASKIPCVRPVTAIKNVLVLDFVGKNGVPEPTLVESEVDYSDYEQAISILDDLYNKANMVHADFSEYNIFKTEKGLVVFDFGSAVDIRHPNAKEFFERDIKNITKFFVKRGLTVTNPSDVIKRIMK